MPTRGRTFSSLQERPIPLVDADCEEMVAMFHVTGALIYVDADSGNVTGYDDVFTKLEKAREWYRKCGLGEDYAEKFIR